MYGKFLSFSSHTGRLDNTVSLFRLTPDPYIFLWSSIINSHAFHGLHHSALLSLLPNAFTFSSVLKASPSTLAALSTLSSSSTPSSPKPTALLDMYARGDDVSSACKVFNDIPVRNTITFTAMVTCYAKAGQLEHACNLFDALPEKDCVCWNALIDAYTQHNHPNDAIMVFLRKLRSGFKPNEVTFVSVVASVAQLGSLPTGKWVHSYAKNNKIPFTLRLSTPLVDCTVNAGAFKMLFWFFTVSQTRMLLLGTP